MLISQTESTKYFGKMLIGRVSSGKITVGDKLSAVDSNGSSVE
jgi:predicted membrane GTPase involved in stress response